jgi:hypothetical protein
MFSLQGAAHPIYFVFHELHSWVVVELGFEDALQTDKKLEESFLR